MKILFLLLFISLSFSNAQKKDPDKILEDAKKTFEKVKVFAGHAPSWSPSRMDAFDRAAGFASGFKADGSVGWGKVCLVGSQ